MSERRNRRAANIYLRVSLALVVLGFVPFSYIFSAVLQFRLFTRVLDGELLHIREFELISIDRVRDCSAYCNCPARCEEFREMILILLAYSPNGQVPLPIPDKTESMRID